MATGFEGFGDADEPDDPDAQEIVVSQNNSGDTILNSW